MRKIHLLILSLLFLLSFCSQPNREPDVVRVRLAADPENLSPVSYTKADALQIVNLLFQSLLSIDLADNVVKPGLAESLPIIDRQDSVTFITYQIRKEAKWSDGSPVTAEDYAFTLKVLKAPLLNNELLRPQVDFIKSIIIDENDNKKFTLICEGYTPEMALLTGDFFVLPAYLFDPDNLLSSFSVSDFSDNLSELENNPKLQTYATAFNSAAYSRSKDLLKGSGGYELETWKTGQYLTLKRKESWWAKELSKKDSYLTANPARISFRIIPDNATALLALRNKELDVLDNIPASEFTQLKKDEVFLKHYNLFSPDSYDFVYAGINSRLPKFKDKQTRQAITHLLDLNSFMKVSQQMYATPTVGPVPPSVTQYYNNSLTPIQYAPGKAVEMLKAAGWKRTNKGWFKEIDGKKVKLEIEFLIRAGNTAFENSALIFQQSAASIGIPVTLQATENSLFRQKVNSHQFDMFFRALSGNPYFFDFKPFLHTYFAGPNGLNSTGFGTPESDLILEGILTTESEAHKAELLKRLQAILQEEATFIPLYFQKERLAISKRYNNLKISGLRPNYDVSAFTLKK